MIVKVTDSIFINEKAAEEKLENLQELKFRLDSYCSAAKAGGHEPKVLLRTSRNTKDSLLKKALEAFQFVHIRHVSLAPVPPVNPPRKRIHQPLPRKP